MHGFFPNIAFTYDTTGPPGRDFKGVTIQLKCWTMLKAGAAIHDYGHNF
jgi:hypothetical protein